MKAMWYALVQDEQLGPMDFDEIIDFYYKDIISSDTLLWREGLSGWLPISQIKEFKDLLFQGVFVSVTSAPQAGGADTRVFTEELGAEMRALQRDAAPPLAPSLPAQPPPLPPPRGASGVLRARALEDIEEDVELDELLLGAQPSPLALDPDPDAARLNAPRPAAGRLAPPSLQLAQTPPPAIPAHQLRGEESVAAAPSPYASAPYASAPYAHSLGPARPSVPTSAPTSAPAPLVLRVPAPRRAAPLAGVAALLTLGALGGAYGLGLLGERGGGDPAAPAAAPATPAEGAAQALAGAPAAPLPPPSAPQEGAGAGAGALPTQLAEPPAVGAPLSTPLAEPPAVGAPLSTPLAEPPAAGAALPSPLVEPPAAGAPLSTPLAEPPAAGAALPSPLAEPPAAGAPLSTPLAEPPAAGAALPAPGAAPEGGVGALGDELDVGFDMELEIEIELEETLVAAAPPKKPGAPSPDRRYKPKSPAAKPPAPRGVAKPSAAKRPERLAEKPAEKPAQKPAEKPAAAAEGTCCTREQINRVVSGSLGKIKACAEGDAALKGSTVVVSITIMPSGGVESARAITSSLRQSPQGGCVVQAVQALKFPLFSGEPLPLQLPLKL